MEERKENGEFTSLANFLTRIHDRNLNKKSLEALIMTGAFDRFDERGKLFAALDHLLEFNREHMAGQETGQDSLFGAVMSNEESLTIPDCPPATTDQKLIWEKELLGVYVSGHPLDAQNITLVRVPKALLGYSGRSRVCFVDVQPPFFVDECEELFLLDQAGVEQGAHVAVGVASGLGQGCVVRSAEAGFDRFSHEAAQCSLELV